MATTYTCIFLLVSDKKYLSGYLTVLWFLKKQLLKIATDFFNQDIRNTFLKM